MVNPNAAYDKFKDKHVNTKGLGRFVVDAKSLLSTYRIIRTISCTLHTRPNLSPELELLFNSDTEFEENILNACFAQLMFFMCLVFWLV